MKYLNFLLVFVPISIICRACHVDPGIVFVFTALGIVPLSKIIGDATEQVALYAGPKIGGMLNATMGNVPELLIGIFAVKAGLFSLVLASMAGSVMGNLMLVLGCSVLLGGMRMKFQKFNMNIARSNLTLLAFAAISMLIPFALSKATSSEGHTIPHASMTILSLWIAGIMLVIYLCGLIFSLGTHRNIFTQHAEIEGEEDEKPTMKLRTALLLLAVVTGFVAWECEILVATVESAIEKFHLSEIFVGIILIPILGNVAEHASALMMAWKNKLDISIEIAVGSSMQIALFVAPLCCVISFIFGKPMLYVYGPFEMIGMMSGIAMSLYVFMDGKTNWLEGLLLMGSYCMFAMSFFFIR